MVLGVAQRADSTSRRFLHIMKKLMSIMLGLSLLTGVVAFADDKGGEKKEKGSKKKGGKKKEDKDKR